MPDAELRLLAVNVGNTTTTLAIFPNVAKGTAPAFTETTPTSDPQAAADAIVRLARERLADAERSAIVAASVHDAASAEMIGLAQPRTAERIYRIGRDVPIPIERALPPESLVGADRLLSGLGAYDVLQQACIVVDAGTAITVDFVDGEGVFQGGAIAPGLRMALGALHRGAEALPELEPAPPPADAFGKTTAEAMLLGVVMGVRGLVRILAERYAEAYEAYPPVVACGGDAELLFRDDELIDRVIPDLTMRGVAAACRLAIVDDHAPGGDPDGAADAGGDAE